MQLYFNEIEPFAGAWLQRLYPDAKVSTRDVREVDAREVNWHRRVHLFAGIGGWEYALNLAGWPKGRPVWTGSCPCQPFSDAGQHRGIDDPRHLWPEFRRLVEECHPPTIFGEQVASKAGREWLAGVRDDLEALGYAVGAADLCAASVGAPHIRQRLYWVAHAACGVGHREQHVQERRSQRRTADRRFGARVVGVDHPRLQRIVQQQNASSSEGGSARRTGETVRLVDTGSEHDQYLSGGLSQEKGKKARRSGDGPAPAGPSGPEGLANSVGQRDANDGPGATGEASSGVQGANGQWEWVRPDPWECSDLIYCRDEKLRRVEPGVFPLADGVPSRVGRLRAYGNAIVPQVAATFIRAFLEAEGG